MSDERGEAFNTDTQSNTVRFRFEFQSLSISLFLHNYFINVVSDKLIIKEK